MSPTQSFSNPSGWLAAIGKAAVPVNIASMVRDRALRSPDAVALGRSDIRLSYRELDALVGQVAERLAALGIGTGARVALIADNCLEYAVALFACLTLDATVVPLSTALSPDEIRARFADVGVGAVIVPRHLASLFDGWRQEAGVAGDAARLLIEVTPDKAVSIEAAGADSSAKPAPLPGTNDGVALILFTAGSTSAPKAVPLTHANLLSSIRGIVDSCRLTAADRTLVVMPLFHGHGLVAGLLSTLASGGAAFLPGKGAFSAHLFRDEMSAAAATWYTAVPTIHRIIVNHAAGDAGAVPALPLRFVRSCSAPLDDELVARLGSLFAAPVIGAYGMTETAHQTASNPLPDVGDNRPGTVGLATGVEARVVRDDGSAAAAGETGEICVRGDSLTSGYLDNPAANAASFVDGWFHTGDLGTIDAAGYIAITGRLKDVINRGGEKISPARIDNVLLSHPAVLEAAAFGEPDAIYGEVVNAAVSLDGRQQVDEAALRGFAAASLAPYEVPVKIYVLDALPHTSKGSVDRKALSDRFRPGT